MYQNFNIKNATILNGRPRETLVERKRITLNDRERSTLFDRKRIALQMRSY